MGETARVSSIDAIVRFRELYAEFAEDTRNTMAAVDVEARRAREWLEHEMPRHWKQQIQLWDRKQQEARSALHRKNLQRTDGFVPDVTQEKEALRIAKQRVEEAQQKLEKIRRWGPQLIHALTEFNGRTSGLREAVGGESERNLMLLTRMIDSLTAYVAMQAPRTGEMAGGGMTSAANPGSASTDWSQVDPEAPTTLNWLDQPVPPREPGEEPPRPPDEEPPTEFEVLVPPPDR